MKMSLYTRVAQLRVMICCVLCTSFADTLAQTADTKSENPVRMIEIRSYSLKPGTREQFHKLVSEALPMLKRWKVDVVAFGPSLHDTDSYFLMRAYNSLEERQKSQDAFYGSEEWKQGPRDAILALIINYTTIVVAADDSFKSSIHMHN